MSKKKELSYEDYSEIRKQGQAMGVVPEWMASAGLQMFMKKYLYAADNPKEQFERIAKTVSEYSPIMLSPQDKLVEVKDRNGFKDYWYGKFFNVLWKGYLAGSTPILSNVGTDRGLPISCSGGIPVGDSIAGFYEAFKEVALLSQQGFGTAVDLSNIRPRGASFKGGGVCTGVIPVVESLVQTTRNVSQGSQRRGSVGCYLDIEHGDFYELAEYLEMHPDDLNVGWIVRDSFIAKLQKGKRDALKRFQHVLYVKSINGKGYIHFIDKSERLKPEAYIKNDLTVSASNLCSEIMLHSDEDETYICCLSWMNLSKYDEWKDTDAVFVATVFLDCIISYFIDKAKGIKGLEKAVRSAERGRPLGLGAGGFNTLLQQQMLDPEGMETHALNNEIFEKIHNESLEASKALAVAEGEPLYCKGLGVRNTHRTAVAPTKSTALIYGGVSEGCMFDVAMSFTQSTPAGEVARVNPTLLKIIKSKGLNVEQCISDVHKKKGSVQHVSWLTPFEKKVFKTAFEIDKKVVLRLAAARQKHLCQGQSLNLAFDSKATEEQISEIYQIAFMNPNTIAVYYQMGMRGLMDDEDDVQVVAEPEGCESCQ